MRIAHTVMRLSAVAGALALTLAACKTERSQAGMAGRDTAAQAAATPGAGGAPRVAMRNFNGDPRVAVQGRELFIRYNCYGCHGGLGGGAMGPSLRDDLWKFGGSDTAIHLSIVQGRPAGMPKWGGVIPDSNVNKLVVYIRSLRSSAEPTFFFSPTDTTTKAAMTASR
jgi:mono/diheme cytochrome c family protein